MRQRELLVEMKMKKENQDPKRVYLARAAVKTGTKIKTWRAPAKKVNLLRTLNLEQINSLCCRYILRLLTQPGTRIYTSSTQGYSHFNINVCLTHSCILLASTTCITLQCIIHNFGIRLQVLIQNCFICSWVFNN